jgi:quercetin dioxygenase-like cupin family protein
MKFRIIAATCATFSIAAPAYAAAAPNFAGEIPNIPGKSLIANEVSYAPGEASPAHTHGPVAFIYAYVISGAIESKVNDGEARIYHAGESFSEPPGAMHWICRNASKTEPAKFLAIFVTDTDAKPKMTPIK